MNKLFTFIISLLLLSCIPAKERELLNALELAGDNRAELEKVLTHYKDDSLKLEAACFLIRNMPLHNSYTVQSAEIYHQQIDSLLPVISACPVSKREELLNSISSTLKAFHFTI